MCEPWYRPNYPETGEKGLYPLSELHLDVECAGEFWEVAE